MAIEITAAGIEVEKVRPALSPKYTLAAVKTNVMMIPMIRPRMVSSARLFMRMSILEGRRIGGNRQMGQGDVRNLRLFNQTFQTPFADRSTTQSDSPCRNEARGKLPGF